MKNWTKILVITIFSIVIVCAFVITCISRKNTPAHDVVHYDGFDDKDISNIQSVYDSKLDYLKATDINDVDLNKYKILYLEVSKEKRPDIDTLLKEKLKNQCQVFYSRISYDSNPEIICFLKSNEKFDVLRALGTNGINYNIDTDQLVDKLTIWDKDYGIEIVGADSDWVDIKFSKLPKDIKKFAQEIYEFCPDSVDQGVGSIEELENYLKENNGVFLWWD